MLEITSFLDASRVVYRGSQGIEILSGSENRGSSPLESCVGGHRASKSSQDRNPRKWPEIFEITSFVDAARVVYQGSQGIKILPRPKIVGYNPRKQPEMLKITSFDDAARVVYRGSQGIEILSGLENHGL